MGAVESWVPTWFPDMNAPVLQVSKLPVVTRWMVVWAILGILIWIAVMLFDNHKHSCHRDHCSRLESRVQSLEAHLGLSSPSSSSSSSSSS